jgi:hypothetical protein
MDTLSYAYANEAHDRIDELEQIVTKSGDVVNLTGDILGTTNVAQDGSINITTVVTSDSHEHTTSTITDIQVYIDKNAPLSKIVENTNIGYRLSDAIDENYGIIGHHATDLSYSSDTYEQNGAIGDYSIATGEGTVAKRSHSFVTGKYNQGKENTVLEVGIGTDKNSRRNALEVYEDGRILAPSLTPDKITEEHSFVTKKYIDYLVIDCGTF